MKRSDILFLAATFLSFLLSVYLWFNGQREEGLFVGLWVPSIMICAVFIKMIAQKTINEK